MQCQISKKPSLVGAEQVVVIYRRNFAKSSRNKFHPTGSWLVTNLLPHTFVSKRIETDERSDVCVAYQPLEGETDNLAKPNRCWVRTHPSFDRSGATRPLDQQAHGPCSGPMFRQKRQYTMTDAIFCWSGIIFAGYFDLIIVASYLTLNPSPQKSFM